nr:vegetative cell wall protein gp1-like [Aegilops tauschii subsp. strangulata]
MPWSPDAPARPRCSPAPPAGPPRPHLLSVVPLSQGRTRSSSPCANTATRRPRRRRTSPPDLLISSPTCSTDPRRPYPCIRGEFLPLAIFLAHTHRPCMAARPRCPRRGHRPLLAPARAHRTSRPRVEPLRCALLLLRPPCSHAGAPPCALPSAPPSAIAASLAVGTLLPHPLTRALPPPRVRPRPGRHRCGHLELLAPRAPRISPGLCRIADRFRPAIADRRRRPPPGAPGPASFWPWPPAPARPRLATKAGCGFARCPFAQRPLRPLAYDNQAPRPEKQIKEKKRIKI